MTNTCFVEVYVLQTVMFWAMYLFRYLWDARTGREWQKQAYASLYYTYITHVSYCW